MPIGKVSFDRRQLLENFRAVIDELQRAKPASAKGRYIRSVTVSSTMGPGVKVDPNRLAVTDDERAGRPARSLVACVGHNRSPARRRHPVRSPDVAP